MSLSTSNAPPLAMAAGFAVAVRDLADARVGRGRSLGSRGSKTYTAPLVTNTAPSSAPIQRSMTDRPARTTEATEQQRAASVQQLRLGRLHVLLTGGLIAAGLGSIFGFGTLVGVLGFLLQFALIGGAIYLVVNFLRNRNQPALAPWRGSVNPSRDTGNRSSYVFSGGAPISASPLTIGQDDFEEFERLLGEIQTAYGRQDIEELGARTTPELFSYFSKGLYEDENLGLRNRVYKVKLLQGDLSEGWRENGSDYATVAMRYSLIDTTVDRATEAAASGDVDKSSEVTELWTFRRDDRARADGWQLSAIQQTT